MANRSTGSRGLKLLLQAMSLQGQVRECQGPPRQVSRTSVSGPSAFFGMAKTPVGAMLAGHFCPRGDIVLGICIARSFIMGCRVVAARRSIEGNPRRHGICLVRQPRSSRFFSWTDKVPNGPRKLRVPANYQPHATQRR